MSVYTVRAFRYSNYKQPRVYVCISTLLGSLPHTVCYICRVCGQERCPEGLLLKSVAALSNILSTEAEVSSKYVCRWLEQLQCCLSLSATLVFRRLSACPSSVSLFGVLVLFFQKNVHQIVNLIYISYVLRNAVVFYVIEEPSCINV